MAGWSSPDRIVIEWDGDIKAKKFRGDGSLLTNLPAGSEVDPVYAATSNALITDGKITATSLAYSTSLTDALFVYTSNAQTFLNKTFNLANNTLTGTSLAFNTALSDGTFLMIGAPHASLADVGTNTHAQIDTHIASLAQHSSSRALLVVFQGASGAAGIPSGTQIDLAVPFNCVIKRVTQLGSGTGVANIDVWKDTYANFPPTAADNISGPGIMMATAKEQNAGTSWSSLTLTTGDILRFNVSGATTINRVATILEVIPNN